MSKKFKSQASAAGARAASTAFRSSSPAFGFGSPATTGFQTAASSLSYIAEQPDLSTVSNANLVVTLRNLGKKDSTTKAKALEELQDYVSSLASGDAIEAGLVEAWVCCPSCTPPSLANSPCRSVCILEHPLIMPEECANSPMPYKAPSLPLPESESQPNCPRSSEHGYPAHTTVTDWLPGRHRTQSLRHSAARTRGRLYGNFTRAP